MPLGGGNPEKSTPFRSACGLRTHCSTFREASCREPRTSVLTAAFSRIPTGGWNPAQLSEERGSPDLPTGAEGVRGALFKTQVAKSCMQYNSSFVKA